MASLSKGKSKSSAISNDVATMYLTSAGNIGAELAHGERDSKQESAACPLKEEPYGSIPTAAVGTEELTGNFEAIVIPKGKQEFRSRRVQCVFTPSLYSELKAAADEDNLSVNDVINQLVTSYVKNRKGINKNGK